MPSRVLIVSHEAPGQAMAGPAIRYWELAQALAVEHAVTLAAPAPPALQGERVRLVGYEPGRGEALRAYLAEADVVVVTGYLLRHYPFLRRGPPLVVDLYTPFVLENLAIHAHRSVAGQEVLHRINLAVLNEQLRDGDFFLCASERQRDFWLGMLAANGRVNPHTLRADSSLRQLIAVVPFGLPAEPPRRHQAALKGVVPGIGLEDRVIFWGGGLWDWLDPVTAIRAAALLAGRPDPICGWFLPGSATLARLCHPCGRLRPPSS